jgi:hypothetical protein
VVLKAFTKKIEAEIAKGFLASNNIDSIIATDTETADSIGNTGNKLMVRKENSEEAIKLLNSIDK